MLNSFVGLFSKKERFTLIIAITALVISSIFLISYFLSNKTYKAPAYGGSYTEGIVGQPQYLIPILTKNSTVDRDLSTLLFANIFDLAESINSDPAFKTWTVRIKENAKWHNNDPITSDDIIFTIHSIQNPDTLSPFFSDWQNITASRISEREVEFKIATSYSIFSNLLKDLRPIPKKLFADIAPANLRISLYKLEPIGSGPYKFDSIDKRGDGFISSISLSENENYQSIGKLPYIKNFTVKFFENESKIISAYNRGTIDGFGTSEQSTLQQIVINKDIKDVPTSKYYALFYNANANPSLSDISTRKALTYAINKTELIEKAFDNHAISLNGPIPPTLESYNSNINEYYKFDPQLSKNIFETNGWKLSEDQSAWTKNGKVLSLTIKTPDTPTLVKVAEIIKTQWENAHIKTNIIAIDPERINDETVKTRDYEVLLYGNIVALNPELFSFWHSSEKFYPGLNLSFFDNKDVDNAIMTLRKIDQNDPKHNQLLNNIQEVISTSYPATFLMSPNYFYIRRSNVPGIGIRVISTSSDRFNDIVDWYVKTKTKLK